LDACALQGGGQGHELGRVAGQAFHLVDGEDDRLVGGGLFDVAGELDRVLKLGSDLDPGADFSRRRSVCIRRVLGRRPDWRVLGWRPSTGRSRPGSGGQGGAGGRRARRVGLVSTPCRDGGRRARRPPAPHAVRGPGRIGRCGTSPRSCLPWFGTGCRRGSALGAGMASMSPGP